MPYEYHDYKAFITDACEKAGLPFARVAEAAGLHRQYLTQVLKYKAQLSDEQAHRVGVHLGLKDGALAYFLLLVQEAKTTHPASRRYFAARRAELRAAKPKLSDDLAKATQVVGSEPAAYTEFFLDVTTQICHAHFFIPAFQKEPRLLREKLRLTAAELDEIVRRLERMGLVERAGVRIRALVPFLHLDPGSALSTQNHRNWRIYAAHVSRTDGGKKGQDLFFTGTITSDARARKALVEKLRAVIAEFHVGLGDTDDDEAFQVNVDVFGL